MKLEVIFFIAFSSCLGSLFSQTAFQCKLDSIDFYLFNSSDGAIHELNKKLSYGLKAKKAALDLRNDSLILKSNINLSSLFLEKKNNAEFLRLSKESLKTSERLKDSLSIALVSKRLGDYYYNVILNDSAYYYYYKSEKYYRALNDDFNTAVLLLDIALIQQDEKDLTGAELTAIEGVIFLDKLKPSNEVLKKKAFFYNSLGLTLGNLEQFEKSIEYHKKAIELKQNLTGDYTSSIDNSLNNIALSYKDWGKYELAEQYFSEILEKKNLVNERPDFYALVLDNYAHTLFLSKKFKELPQLYLKVLKIHNSIGDFDSNYNPIGTNHNLAEYYNYFNKKDSAKYYAYQAKEISEQYHNDGLLKSLLLLSKIEDDSIAVKHYDAYIKLSDSLQKQERSIRNKFARIRFETKEIEKENVQIEREKLWLMLLSGTLIFTVLLIYIIVGQRNKNKELKFIQQQQEANEEIYNLMLSQQDKIEEARNLEKKRVSQELHDGVLGRLFGTRLSLDSLNMSSTQEAVKTRSQYIDELKTIEQDIRKVSHELNTDFISGSGFVDIIKSLVETQTEVYNLKYKLTCDDSINWDDVSNKTKIHLYRMVQETMHNIHKHAQANLLQISFELKNNVIWLTISDDGVGFDVDKAKKGIGIKNMNSRINEMNGILHIKSEKNKGTTVIITLPT